MLVHECLLVDQDECYAFLEFSEGKPYHVPEKELLLQYATEEFYEETPEITAMRAVFADMGMSPARQENELLEVLVFARESAGRLPEVFDDIQRRKLTFNDRTLRGIRSGLTGTCTIICRCRRFSGCTPVELLEVFPGNAGRDFVLDRRCLQDTRGTKANGTAGFCCCRRSRSRAWQTSCKVRFDLKKLLEDVPGQLPS